MSNSNDNSIIRGFAAETLLGEDAHVIKEITNLRNDLRYATNGSEVSLDDSFVRLQQETDNLPRIVLDMDVPPGTENEYLIRLSTAQEKVLDDCDRVLRHTLEFQSKLKNAERAIKKYKADFMAWYTLSAAYVIESHEVKFSAPQIKQLAEAEFSRLLDNLDVQIDNLISSVEHLIDEIRQHKKIQSEKHALGKDQANASWTSKMANPNGIAPSRADDMAQEPDFEEEEDDDVPAFVSRRPQISETPKVVTSNQDLLNEAKPGDTVILRFTDNVAPILSEIKDEVHVTGPVTLPLVTDPEEIAAFLSDEPEQPFADISDSKPTCVGWTPESEPKFRVHGETDPKFATSWKPEFRGPVAACETVVSTSSQTMSPRKRLIVTEDEELM